MALALILAAFESFTVISAIYLTSPLTIFEQLSTLILPILIKNLLYTYIAINSTCIGAIIYEFTTKLLLWVSPILPNTPWVMEAIINITIPIILFLYIRYIKNKKEIFSNKANKKHILYLNPKGLIPIFIICVFVIWFAIGVFPIKPMAIATGSMVPNLNVGDVVILQRVNPSDVKVQDIIEFTYGKRRVVHRVVEIKRKPDGLYFITKGDHNPANDINPVYQDQVVSKAIFRMPLLGYPAIWINFSSGWNGEVI